MPVNVGVRTSKNKSYARTFEGLDSLEDIKKPENGIVLKVSSFHPSSVNCWCSIIIKMLEIGK